MRQARIVLALIAAILVLGALDFVAGTIWLTPDTDVQHPVSWIAYPGELVHVNAADLWKAAITTDDAVVKRLGNGWFMAALPGTAYLVSADSPPPGELRATFLWRATIRVRIPGT